jgi:hypothetical protein
VQEVLGPWFGYAWDSPEKGFVNTRKRGAAEEGKGGEAKEGDVDAPWLTPAASPTAKASR